MHQIIINHKALSLKSCSEFITCDESGGQNIFIGTVRSKTKEKKVTHLEYEAYVPMAFKEFEKIVAETKKLLKCQRIYVAHRTGILQLGDVAVIIGVSTAHRAEAFAACRYLIDETKKRVPIWKKEFFADGSHWVNAHP